MLETCLFQRAASKPSKMWMETPVARQGGQKGNRGTPRAGSCKRPPLSRAHVGGMFWGHAMMRVPPTLCCQRVRWIRGCPILERIRGQGPTQTDRSTDIHPAGEEGASFRSGSWARAKARFPLIRQGPPPRPVGPGGTACLDSLYPGLADIGPARPNRHPWFPSSSLGTLTCPPTATNRSVPHLYTAPGPRPH